MPEQLRKASLILLSTTGLQTTLILLNFISVIEPLAIKPALLFLPIVCPFLLFL
ncbi:hypothetical protein BDF14DRAFT_1857812 [Spinellus fusiger]|nr:hypothetical protein BDF14DRAFT_1857812 [Spinellus fusiger]